MTKIIITPLDKDSKPIARGKTSIDGDSSAKDLTAKIAAAAKRAGKKVVTVDVDGIQFNTDGTATSHRDYRRDQTKPAKPVILSIIEALESVGGEAPGWTLDALVEHLATHTGRTKDGLTATVRTQLSRLRRDGHSIVRTKVDKVNHYRIVK